MNAEELTLAAGLGALAFTLAIATGRRWQHVLCSGCFTLGVFAVYFLIRFLLPGGV